MNSQYTYFLILALSLLGPLALSFDKKVAFYRQWKYVFGAMILPAAFFIMWDIRFTNLDVWSFSNEYTIGWNIVNIPVEEALFFFVVPYCCTFIYECIRCYFPKLQNTRFSRPVMSVLAMIILTIAVLNMNRYYTFYTGIFTAAFIFLLLIVDRFGKIFNITAFLISYIIILLPFLAVNGVLTYLPVVMYNDAHNLCIRIISIPIEDVFYGMLLVMMNIYIFERLRRSAVRV